MGQKIDYVENKLYFNSVRNYTAALLNAFDNVKRWVTKTDEDGNPYTDEYTIPITFANYEKFVALDDISADQIIKGNLNFLPRMSLSFDGMAYASDRMTNKFNYISRKWEDDDGSHLDLSYNSVPYDISFRLNIQARGLNEAFQIVEQILPKFRPTMPIEINEFPLFEEWVTTQVIKSDPEFEILEEFAETDINIINVSIPLTIRGNIYSSITIQGPIETMKLASYIWYGNRPDDGDERMAWFYQLSKNEEGTEWIVDKDLHFAPPRN